jgi:triacylglycerol lipase
MPAPMSAARVHHVFLIPGLFGFGKLAGYDYFEHLERALGERFARAGAALRTSVVSTPPTASIPVRAGILAQQLASASDGEHIHLLGHSTGGLDARLLLSPGARLPSAPAHERVAQVRSVVTINTPHYGTPLAGYFTTVAGTRMLSLLSLLTVASLGVGRLPLAAFSGALGAVGRLDKSLGFQLRLLDELTTQLLRFVGAEGRDQIRDYLGHVKHDQGGIVQLMPEVMELFNATVLDAPGVRYGCVATAAPAPGPRRVMAAVGRPISAFHLAVYSTVYGFASRAAARYPYASLAPEQAQRLTLSCPVALRAQTVDGIVPTLSMLWGQLIWCGAADHLDVVGHFGDTGKRPRQHVDWLRSGANFQHADFAAMADALGDFLLAD